MFRRLMERGSSSGRGVICLNFVLPVRIAAFSMLGGNWVYIMLNLDSVGVITVFGTLLTLILVWTMLKECRRSIAFHKELESLEGNDITRSASE